MSVNSEVKGLVETAIRVLDGGNWSPLEGGEYDARNGAKVIINRPTRFCIKPSYRVIHPEFGVFIGYLNGTTGRNVGKSAQIMTREQMARDQTYDPTEEIAKALA